MLGQVFLSLLPLFLAAIAVIFIFIAKISKSGKSQNPNLPKSYPIIGSYLTTTSNNPRRLQWVTDILQSSPTATFTLDHPFGYSQVFTANPAVVQHMLKTNFPNYQKGPRTKAVLSDFMGDGIFNSDGDSWKFQRQVASNEFNTKSLRRFMETVVDKELTDRLVQVLSDAAVNRTVLDFQDILQRFAFDNICKIAFGYDPADLSSSLPQTEFAQSFEDASNLSSERLRIFPPIVWKFKRLFGIGSEVILRNAAFNVRDFARGIVREKKQELKEKSSLESMDLLSRFLISGHSDEKFATDIVISFILAGRDTTSAALTWFFWLISRYPKVELEILREISEKSYSPIFEEIKDMVYTHACLCETMRLYPPVPTDSKVAMAADVLPGGTKVKKGTVVTYHPYAMGRMERIWGLEWAEFNPERWLERDAAGKWSFVSRDPYTYPVFQAGPRICLGREMAFLQMKRIVAGVMRRFKLVPLVEEGVEPELVAYLTTKMKGGLPVRVEERSKI